MFAIDSGLYAADPLPPRNAKHRLAGAHPSPRKPQGSAQWPVMDRQVGDRASFIARNDCNAAHADVPEGARLPLEVLAASIDRLVRELQALVNFARRLHDTLNVLAAAHRPVHAGRFENHVLGKGGGEGARASLREGCLIIRRTPGSDWCNFFGDLIGISAHPSVSDLFFISGATSHGPTAPMPRSAVPR
jgi:hypothetical protein